MQDASHYTALPGCATPLPGQFPATPPDPSIYRRLQGIRAADSPTPLPSGVSAWDLLHHLRQLGPVHGYNASLLRVLECLIRRTRAEDWTRDGPGPMCWVEQRELADELGIEPRSLRYAEQRLVDLGLVAKAVRGDGRRGRMGGSLHRGFGLSLAPMAARHAEFAAAAREAVTRRRERSQLRGAISRAKREVRNLLALADTPGAASWLADMQARVDALPRRPSRISDRAALQAAWADVMELRAEVLARMDPTERPDSSTRPDHGRKKFSAAAENSFRRHTEDVQNHESTTSLQATDSGPTGRDGVEPPRPVVMSCAEERQRAVRRKMQALMAEFGIPEETPAPRQRQTPDRAGQQERRPPRPDRKAPVLTPQASELLAVADPDIRWTAETVARMRNTPAERAIWSVVHADLARWQLTPRFFEQVSRQIGPYAAAAAVIALDRNQSRSARPVRSVGAALRGIHRKSLRGEPIDLAASVRAIRARDSETRH